jgi:HAD superfamily hydrolase (TIGR01509 family)
LRPPRFRVSHVLLDIDGTLADYNEATGRTAVEAAAARCRALTGEEITPRQLLLARDAVEHDPAWSALTTTHVRREALRRVLSPYGAASVDQIAEVMAVYEEARDRAMPLFPDALPALEALRALGVTLIATSNGDFDLERVGLGGYFSGRYYAIDAGVTKVDPRFFPGALSHLGVTPRDALMVGDRYDNDYIPAVAAGLHAVLLERPPASPASPVDASAIRIASLAELPPLVEPRSHLPFSLAAAVS